MWIYIMFGSLVLIISPTWHVSLLVGHMRPRGHLSKVIFLSTSVDKEYYGRLLRSINIFKKKKSINLIEIINCGFYILYLIQAFRYIPLHDFDVGLLIRVYYPKRSSRLYSNFLPDLINGAYLLFSLLLLLVLSFIEIYSIMSTW